MAMDSGTLTVINDQVISLIWYDRYRLYANLSTRAACRTGEHQAYEVTSKQRTQTCMSARSSVTHGHVAQIWKIEAFGSCVPSGIEHNLYESIA